MAVEQLADHADGRAHELEPGAAQRDRDTEGGVECGDRVAVPGLEPGLHGRLVDVDEPLVAAIGSNAVVMGAEPDRYVLQLGDVETPGGSKGVDQRCVIEPGRLGVHGRDGTQHRRRARRLLNRARVFRADLYRDERISECRVWSAPIGSFSTPPRWSATWC